VTVPVDAPLHNASVLLDVAKVIAKGSPMVTVLVLLEQLSVTVKVYSPAGKLFTVAVVPTSTFELFFQLQVVVPRLLLTAPAVTVPVDAPLHNASVLVDAAKVIAKGSPMVTLLDRKPQLSVTVNVYSPAGKLLTVAVVPTSTLELFFQL
jgi:hypothetical protein